MSLFHVYLPCSNEENSLVVGLLWEFREVPLTALPDIQHTTLCAGEGEVICQCWPKLQIARPSIDKGYLIALLWYRHQPDSSLESEWTVFKRRDDTGTLQHYSMEMWDIIQTQGSHYQHHCTVLNEPDITQPLNFYFCTTNSVFSANNSVFIFLSVIFMSKSCLHEKSPVVF